MQVHVTLAKMLPTIILSTIVILPTMSIDVSVSIKMQSLVIELADYAERIVKTSKDI
jgi:hypothetical protein